MVLGFLPGPARSVVGGIGKLMILLFIVLYIISPIDFLPEALLGPFGLIDDAVLAMVGFSILGRLRRPIESAKAKRVTYQDVKKKLK